MNENSIAGYRTVRALRDDPQFRTILVRAGTRGEDEDSTGLRVIKRFEPETPVARILSEIECGIRAQGEHFQEIDDIAAAPDGTPVLVLSWQSVGTLRRLLRERQSLRAGEAITILAPLSAALNRIHRAGVALGSITVDAVHFDGAGRPFFAEWEHARAREERPTPRDLQSDPAFQSDRSQFALVASGVLSTISADRDSERLVTQIVEWLQDSVQLAAHDWELQCERRLFALGAPEPVRLSPHYGAQPAQSPPATLERSVMAPAESEVSASEWGAVFALPKSLQERIEEMMHRVRGSGASVVGAVRAWCAPVRKRTWIMAAAGAASLGLATTVVVVDGAGARSDALVGVSSETGGPDRSDGSGTALAGKADQTDGNNPTQPRAIDREGDVGTDLPSDALEALPILLGTRADCLRDLSVECLEAVSRHDSPAFASDSQHITQVLAGDELFADLLFDASEAQEVQRLGDSVLFEFETDDTSKPASLLLVKGEAGWRIRSYTLPQ